MTTNTPSSIINAALVATGSELISGKTVDSNSAYIAQQLQQLGIVVGLVQVVGDSEAQIADAVRRALVTGAQVIITTGGMGPTVDDKTRAGVAAATNRHLVLDAPSLVQIEQRFASLGRKMSANNALQAYLPDGALAMENPVGSAPIFALNHAGQHIIALPGVPSEMKYLLAHAVQPYLRQQFTTLPVLLTEALHTAGIGESDLDLLIGEFEANDNPSVGVSAKPGRVDVYITAQAHDAATAAALLAPTRDAILARLHGLVYGCNGETLTQAVLRLLCTTRQTVATAESGTQGKLTALLDLSNRELDDISQYYAGGIVLPPTEAQPLSEWATVLANQAQRLYHADYVIAVIQRPQRAADKARKTSEVAFVVLAGGQRLVESTRTYPTTAAAACEWAATTALWRLWQHLNATGAIATQPPPSQSLGVPATEN